jgi:hypothetical protein
VRLLIDPASPAEITAAISRLHSSAELRAEMGGKGRRVAARSSGAILMRCHVYFDRRTDDEQIARLKTVSKKDHPREGQRQTGPSSNDGSERQAFSESRTGLHASDAVEVGAAGRWWKRRCGWRWSNLIA